MREGKAAMIHLLITRIGSRFGCTLILTAAVAWFALQPKAILADEQWEGFLAAPSWERPTQIEVRDQLESWLRDQSIPLSDREQILDAWDHATGESSGYYETLDVLVWLLARVDARIVSLIDHCQSPSSSYSPASFSWLAESHPSTFFQNNLKLYYVRWLVQSQHYDEALLWATDLSTADVVSPDTLLFCSAVSHHALVNPDEAEMLASRLLEREDSLPLRYQQLARLMIKDVERLEDDSLDHIARRMTDIRRRLALGRAGERVQTVERGVIESLDKLIDELEKQQQQQASQQAQSGGPPSGQPMQESRLAELKAPGKVQPKDIGDGTDWGDLPPKEREQALQQIGREFPSHYREIIQQYFRELAGESTKDDR